MPENYTARRWHARLERNNEGAPTLSPFFVIEQGADVHLVDLRDPREAEGVFGHIPGSVFLDPAKLPPGEAVVLIDRDGVEAARVAQTLEEGGRKLVAAMAGGLAAWRQLGLVTSRGPVQPPESRRTSAGKGRLTLEELRKHLGDPRSVRWVKLALLLSSWHLSCIDGRDGRGIIGTPGGDAGEFLLLMAALEKVTGRRFDDAAVEQALLAHFDACGNFYVHTDAHAVEHLLEAARSDLWLRAETEGLQTAAEGLAFLSDPPERVRAKLLDLLVDPAHIGCGHIRLMLLHGAEYETRPALVAAFWRAVYRLWWAGAPELTFRMLPGGHGEVGVANIHTAGEDTSLSSIPLVSPSCHGRQLFIIHPDAVAHFRRVLVEHHASGPGSPELDPSQEAELREVVEALAKKQLTATAGYLAPDLPAFDVTFEGREKLEVHGG